MRLVDREVEEEGAVIIPMQEADARLDQQISKEAARSLNLVWG